MRYIKKLDIIAPNPSARLHFGVNADHQTVTGGLCSIVAIVIFVIIAGNHGIQIVNGETPKINTIK
jgi:hypothetical protein